MTGKLHLTDTAIVNKNYTGYSDVHYDMQVVGVCTELNLFMCASFRVFSLNFDEDKFPLADFLRDNTLHKSLNSVEYHIVSLPSQIILSSCYI